MLIHISDHKTHFCMRVLKFQISVSWLSVSGIWAFFSMLFWVFNPFLSDPVWDAGSGRAILKNFPILNCGRCLTKAWTRRTKTKRRMTMQMARRKMMTMSWMTWRWCLTEAGEIFRTIDCAGAATTLLKCAGTPWLSRRWCLHVMAVPLGVRTSWCSVTSPSRWRFLHSLFIAQTNYGTWIISFLSCQEEKRVSFRHWGFLKAQCRTFQKIYCHEFILRSWNTYIQNNTCVVELITAIYIYTDSAPALMVAAILCPLISAIVQHTRLLKLFWFKSKHLSWWGIWKQDEIFFAF